MISTRPADAKGIKLNPVDRTIDDNGYHYKYVDVDLRSRGANHHADGARARGRSAAERSKRFMPPAISGGRCRWRANWTMPS